MTEKSKPTLDLHYLQRLAELYPTIAKASTEIINLQSILNLPKGTEHFITDIHGEYEAFSHVLKNGSGTVRKKIDATSENGSKNTRSFESPMICSLFSRPIPFKLPSWV